MRSLGIPVACLALLLLAYPAGRAWSAEHAPNPAFASRVAAAQQAEKQAWEALERALSIQGRAESAQNVRALQVSRLAVSRARDALARATAVREQRARHLTVARRAAERLAAKARPGQPDNEVVALPTTVKGDVNIKTEQGWKPLDGSTPFGPGDVIKTGPGSHLELVTPDGFIIRMGPKSSITASQRGRSSRWERVKGRVRFTVMCLKRKGLVNELMSGRDQVSCTRPFLRLRLATLAVRGTEFEVESIDEQATRIRVTEGTVELTLEGHEAPIAVPADHEAILRDGAIEGPKPFEPAPLDSRKENQRDPAA
jgi:hypothetical protein